MCQGRRFMRKALVCISVVGSFLAGCATPPDKVKSSYVSPVLYQSLGCTQLSEEAQRVSNRAVEISGAQKSKANKDAVATGVALVLFWPAAFLVGGDDETTAELARLKGEMEAIEMASGKKGCGIRFEQG